MALDLLIAGLLAIGVAIAHSVLGERYLIGRLLRRGDLPRLTKDPAFTGQTIRFAWHLTSVAWIGLGAALIAISRHESPESAGFTPVTTDTIELVTNIIGLIFLASAVITALASRFRHLAWPVFLAIALLCLS